MKSLLDLYGQQFRNPMLNSDSEDYTTADVFGQMGANKRRDAYDNSLLGMVHNWATSEQRQPVQLPDDASWLDQAKEAGLRMLNLPNDMAAGGAKTMAHWLGAAGNPEMVEPLDMLAPLGIGAMAGMAGGLPSNSVGIFGGKLAKTADHAALARAEQMAAQGVDRDTIWKDTGWGRGVDGQWRFEIDDSTASLPHNQIGKIYEGPIGKLIDHPSLDAAYPSAMKPQGQITLDPNASGATGVAYKNGYTAAKASNVPDARTAFLHELQHQIQGKENFSFGSKGGLLEDFSTHKRYAGENEAYAVEKRANMTADERRARPMWYDYDVPENQQIVRFNADQSRSSLPGLLANALDEQPTGIRAFHGSPHDFDRFDMSKIGTGEGAQAYGHGLYFAENEGVARSYKDKLGGLRSGFEINGKSYDPIGGRKEAARLASAERLDQAVAREVLAYHDKTPDEMIADVKRWPGGDRDANILAAAEWKRANETKSGGRMYEVRINANPDDFLDWDKPLSQQSEKVRAIVGQAVAIDNVDVRQVPGGWQVFVNDKPASVPYGRKQDADARVAGGVRTSNVTNATNNVSEIARDPALVEQLREAGIPGIRYLDQGSRTAGEGSRNYVVFDDSLVDILRKYGLLGTLGGGSLLASSESEASPAGGLFGVP